jgi:hypothetical protein|tara:strand:- start:142 stop:831 length:690 start_codon:yes stop_codon:yes gene_type:complete
MDAPLRESNTTLSSLILKIDSEDTVNLIDYNEFYWFIEFNGELGYLGEGYILETPEILAFKLARIDLNEEKLIDLKDRTVEEEKIILEKKIIEYRFKIIEEQKAGEQVKMDRDNQIRQEKERAAIQSRQAAIQKEERDRINREEEIIRKGKEELNRRSEINSKYDPLIAKRIINEKYFLGMTDEMARDSLGRPKDINRSVGSWGVHEQWIYSNDLLLYFENGILTSYQN